MLKMKNLKQISMDGPNMNWKFFDCFINERKSEELPGLINTRSCSLHVLNNTFKTGANATGWNLHKLMKACFQILHDSPARREDYITIHSLGSTPPSPLLKGGGGVNFDYLPRSGRNLKFKKRGWKYGTGAGFLKRGTDTFPIYFFQGLLFLHLEIGILYPLAKLCYAYDESRAKKMT